MDNLLTALKITVFIMWVNTLPPLASMMFSERLSCRIDNDLQWLDHKPLFGRHKTLRGLLASLAGGTAVFPLLGVPWWIAAVATLLAMSGDLLSSFTKRRLNQPSGKNIFLLDQSFESLFPAWFLVHYFNISLWYLLIVLICFVPLAYMGACFWTFLNSRTPSDNYPRMIRSTVRLREWRSCHLPLARWQVWFNLTSFLSYRILYTWVFKLSGLHEKGMRNALDIQPVEQTFRFADLPVSFDGFRILLLTDLHLDGLDDLTDRLIDKINTIEVDLCLFGGDIRMETYGPMSPCLRQLKKLIPAIHSRHGILGVLGNHDCLEMSPDFEEAGIIMLVNEAWDINHNGERIWIVGVDDPHYYRVDDTLQAFRHVPENEFVIFLCHSPEAYKSAAEHNARLYLCGHTHGGQIRLPGRGPILTNSRAPRFTADGVWHYRNMTGYTSRGVGASGVPLRFNCPGEFNLITLRREAS